MEKYLETFKNWQNNNFFDAQTRKELSLLDEIKDKKEIEDRFFKDLEFGTAGLRGIIGAGTNRMNKYTVGKATLGFSKYLIDKYGKTNCKKRGVVIARDTRNLSDEFSLVAASIFSNMGILVTYLKEPAPIPQLSYSIRKLNALGGVVITASHNPPEYNGYKAYDGTGCQLLTGDAKEVMEYARAVQDFSEINFEADRKLIKIIDNTNEFVDVVLKQSRIKDNKIKSNLKIVYTPLHGSGFIPVTKALKADGFLDVNVVKEQAAADGNFSTVEAPNPEHKKALELGINFAKTIDADIVLGTDPDCDRIGVAVKDNNEYVLLTGNQIAGLLIDFILNHTNLKKYPKLAMIKSFVTSSFGENIAQKYGVTTFSTPTGFKYIGEKINQFEAAKSTSNKVQDYDYLFGYEESYGYLAGLHARDKDGVCSAVLVSEMAAIYKTQGITLIQKLKELFDEFGYYLDAQDSYVMQGIDGLDKIAEIMKILRTNASPFANAAMLDYLQGVKAEAGFGEIERCNVIKFEFDDGSWIAVRPSGTEPKLKIYYCVRGDDKLNAEAKLKDLRQIITLRLGL